MTKRRKSRGPVGDGRTAAIGFVTTPELKTSAEQVAKAHGWSLSTWLHNLIKTNLPKEKKS